MYMVWLYRRCSCTSDLIDLPIYKEIRTVIIREPIYKLFSASSWWLFISTVRLGLNRHGMQISFHVCGFIFPFHPERTHTKARWRFSALMLVKLTEDDGTKSQRDDEKGEKNAKTIPVVDNYDDEETRLNRSHKLRHSPSSIQLSQITIFGGSRLEFVITSASIFCVIWLESSSVHVVASTQQLLHRRRRTLHSWKRVRGREPSAVIEASYISSFPVATNV